VSEAIVDTLAALHAADISGAGWAGLGQPAGFMARQVVGWSERWERAKTSELHDMEAVAVWLRTHLPAEPASPSLVHGDFKLDNVLLDPIKPEPLSAVLDWEMCALGDPLVDLGTLLAYWEGSPPSNARAGEPVTRRDGWYARHQIIERYAARSGRDLSSMPFYETFALFKIAVIVQQIYVRFVRGATTDQRFARFGERVEQLAGRAAAVAEKGAG
jgi:aminoglycoside phosphotransferase (APT) family kinase protein